MKLQLKHLTGYIPYELNILNNNNIDCISSIHPYDYFIKTVGKSKINIENVMPMLRPLSDLTKEIEVNGETLVPIEKLLKMKYKSFDDENINSRYSEIELSNHNNYAESCFKYHATFLIRIWYMSLKEEPYWIVEKLLEWHFDIYGLIENDLAISIHDVEEAGI